MPVYVSVRSPGFNGMCLAECDTFIRDLIFLPFRFQSIKSEIPSFCFSSGSFPHVRTGESLLVSETSKTKWNQLGERSLFHRNYYVIDFPLFPSLTHFPEDYKEYNVSLFSLRRKLFSLKTQIAFPLFFYEGHVQFFRENPLESGSFWFYMSC